MTARGKHWQFYLKLNTIYQTTPQFTQMSWEYVCPNPVQYILAAFFIAAKNPEAVKTPFSGWAHKLWGSETVSAVHCGKRWAVDSRADVHEVHDFR